MKQGGLNDVLLLPVEVTGNYEVRIVAVNLIKEFKIGLPDPASLHAGHQWLGW